MLPLPPGEALALTYQIWLPLSAATACADAKARSAQPGPATRILTTRAAKRRCCRSVRSFEPIAILRLLVIQGKPHNYLPDSSRWIDAGWRSNRNRRQRAGLSRMQNNPRVSVSQARLWASGNASNDCAGPNQRTACGIVKCRIFMHAAFVMRIESAPFDA